MVPHNLAARVQYQGSLATPSSRRPLFRPPTGAASTETVRLHVWSGLQALAAPTDAPTNYRCRVSSTHSSCGNSLAVVGVVLRWLVCRYQLIRLYEAGFQATSECTDKAELFLHRDTHTVRPQSPRDTRCVHNRLLKLSLPHWAYAKWTTSKPGVRLRIALMASHLLP